MKKQSLKYDLISNLIVHLAAVWLLVNSNVRAQNTQNEWQSTNGPEGGSVRVMGVSHKGHVFVAAENAGVFRWKKDEQGWSLLPIAAKVNALAFDLDMSGTETVFAGTQGGGVYKSKNDGDTWTLAGANLPNNPNVLDLAVMHSDIYAWADNAIYLLKKGLSIWTLLNRGLNESSSIHEIAADSIRAEVYLGAGGKFFNLDGNGDWTQYDSIGLPQSILKIHAFAFHDEGFIFAIVDSGEGSRKVYRFSGSEKWKPKHNSLPNSGVFQLAITPGGVDRIFAATREQVYYSDHDGDSWESIPKEKIPYSILNLAADPAAASLIIFSGTARGIYYSEDNGDIWKPYNKGLVNTEVQACAIAANGDLFAGTKSSGVFRYEPNNPASKWPAVTTGLPNDIEVKAIINHKNRWLLGTYGKGIFYSDNNGSDWASSPGSDNLRVLCFADAPESTSVYAGTDKGIYRYDNNTQRWNVRTDFTVNDSVCAIAIHPETGDIFVGTGSQRVHRYSKTSLQWEPLANTGLPSKASIRALAINPFTNSIFVGTAASGVYRSMNNGQSWEQRIGLGFEINAVAVYPCNYVFAATENNGVYRSSDGGDTWEQITTGLGNLNVQCLVVDEKSGYLFGGTLGNGVFKIALPTKGHALNHTLDFTQRARASDYQPTEYRLLGLPGTSNKSIKEFLQGKQDEDWQVYWDTGNPSTDKKKYLKKFDGSSDFRFSDGRAFWIIHKGPLHINECAPALQPNAELEVQIPLHSGWNAITNPFLEAVSWQAIKGRNGISASNHPIYKYDGETPVLEEDTLRAYVGYYFENNSELGFLKIPAPGRQSALGNNADPAAWRIKISLSANAFCDRTTWLGVSPQARHGLDRFDFRKPRAFVATPMVVFKRRDWDENSSAFASDVRPEIEDFESWDFDVHTISRAATRLAFSGIYKVPAQFEVYLIDESRAQTLNLRADSLYHFTPAAELSKFKIIVGKTAAVQEQLNSVALPKEFALGLNYPNPFNPETTIPVSAPIAVNAQLKIYDLLGKEVKTLYDGNLEPGRHLFIWNGKDESGNTRASGVYFYRLRTSNGAVLTHKMIFMK